MTTRSSRAKKTVSYYEEAVGNSDSSDFELSDAEEAPKKSKKPAGAAKRGRPPKAAAAKAESEAEQTEEPTHTDASADGDGGSEKRPAKRPAPPDSESDAYCSEKDEEPSSGDESDFGGATVVVDVTPRKKQATAKAKGAAASAAAAVSKPGPKKSAAGKQGAAAPRPLLSPPRAPAAGRPRLTSSGSSGSLSLSLGSPARSPGGVKRRAGGASLKDLLRGSNVPRAGLSRRVSLKRTGS
ncbi:hypothetical protein H4R18_003334 [Coemansia javaensis]|uniref:Uncharacterized protein n=1 Tax=Coemansia javaensis TaxID=2761396 RepID=A0A9W8HAR4_9FUNG|nr:hypothetical protein H4R18_003334 [Coemansia javaensis]